MNLINSSSKNFLISRNISKVDGLIALVFYMYIILVMCVCLYLIKSGLLGHLSKSLIKIIFGTAMLLILLIPLRILLGIRKQQLTTVGILRFGGRHLIFVSILLVTYFIYYVLNYGFSSNLIFRLYFYVVAVGFFEELLMRGFIWPRLVTLFGSNLGTIITGILFGFAHAPMSVILNDQDLLLALINNIGFGILSHLLFGYIYLKARHIVIPSVMHGLLDAL